MSSLADCAKGFILAMVVCSLVECMNPGSIHKLRDILGMNQNPGLTFSEKTYANSKAIKTAKELGFGPILDAFQDAAEMYAADEGANQNEQSVSDVDEAVASRIYDAFKEVDMVCCFVIEDVFKKEDLPAEFEEKCKNQTIVSIDATNENFEERIKAHFKGWLCPLPEAYNNGSLELKYRNWIFERIAKQLRTILPTPSANSDNLMKLLYEDWLYAVYLVNRAICDGGHLNKVLVFRKESIKRVCSMAILVNALRALHVNSHDTIKMLIEELDSTVENLRQTREAEYIIQEIYENDLYDKVFGMYYPNDL